MSRIKAILFQRLEDLGMDHALIPGFIRSLANSVDAAPHSNVYQVNERLRYMGWDNVQLDYHTFQLAVTCLESDGLKTLEYKPAQWFESHFSPMKAA